MHPLRILVAIPFLLAGTARAQDAAVPVTPPATEAPAAAPPALLDAAGPLVLIKTSMGDITLQLDPVHAPKTVANFLRYAKEGHYDGTVVYRVAPGFLIQMGSWDANVKGRPVHNPIPLEAGTSNLRGTVAMAHGNDPNSAQADFFINLVDDTSLDPSPADNRAGFAVFAQVVGGMDVADAISKVQVGDHGPMPGAAPVDPILITKIALVPDPNAPPAAVKPLGNSRRRSGR